MESLFVCVDAETEMAPLVDQTQCLLRVHTDECTCGAVEEAVPEYGKILLSILCLLASSADNLCKLFGPRSDLIVFLKYFIEKVSRRKKEPVKDLGQS